jgi:hypothetical protein
LEGFLEDLFALEHGWLDVCISSSQGFVPNGSENSFLWMIYHRSAVLVIEGEKWNEVFAIR